MRILILGGGLSGLSCAYNLVKEGHDVHVVERDNELGGISSSFVHDGFVLDYGPHKIYTQMPHISEEIKKLLGKNLINIPKTSQIQLNGMLFDYPVKITDIVKRMSLMVTAKAGLLYFNAMLGGKLSKRDDSSYEDYLVNRFGRGLYNLVFRDYAWKIWGNPKHLSADLAKTRVSLPGLVSMIIHSLKGGKGDATISADFFQYPRQGGILELSLAMEKIVKDSGGHVYFNTEPKEIRVSKNKVSSVKLSNGKTIRPDFVASTIQIDELATLFRPVNSKLISASKRLKYKSIILIYLVVNRERVLKSNWVFFPEKEFIFNRISEQKQFSDFKLPKDKSVITVEITCDDKDKKWKFTDKEFLELIIDDLEKAGIVKRSEIDRYFTRKIVDAYPVYSKDYKESLDLINEHIDKIDNMITYGRKGLFNYNNMDHCVDMGMIAADHINRKDAKSYWIRQRQKFNKYKIVD